jgi:hypothetical protein
MFVKISIKTPYTILFSYIVHSKYQPIYKCQEENATLMMSLKASFHSCKADQVMTVLFFSVFADRQYLLLMEADRTLLNILTPRITVLPLMHVQVVPHQINNIQQNSQGKRNTIICS